MHIRPTRRSRRIAGLLGVALLHVAMIAAWQRPVSRTDDARWTEDQVLMLLPPSQMHRKPIPADEQPAPAPSRPTRPSRVAPAPVHQEPVEPEEPAELAVEPLPAEEDPFHAEPEQAGVDAAEPTLKERSLSLAKGADKQLRKESRWEKDKVLARESKLAQSIAAAYRDRSFSIVETKLGNGDTLAKVRTPFGTYCVKVNGNGFVGARDPFKDSGKMYLVRCPGR